MIGHTIRKEKNANRHTMDTFFFLEISSTRPFRYDLVSMMSGRQRRGEGEREGVTNGVATLMMAITTRSTMQ